MLYSEAQPAPVPTSPFLPPSPPAAYLVGRSGPGNGSENSSSSSDGWSSYISYNSAKYGPALP